MRLRYQPFAIQLYRRHLGGESVEELAASLGIPEERIRQRIRVAALCRQSDANQDGLLALSMGLQDSRIF